MSREQVLQELANSISTSGADRVLLVAIDGVDTSGKTTLADELRDRIRTRPVVRLSIDGFHNPGIVRMRQGEFSPEGYFEDSFNYTFLREQVLDRIRRGENNVVPGIFDYRVEAAVHKPPLAVPPKAVVIMDGVFLLRRELAEYWDLSVFLEVSFETVLERARLRDIGLFGEMALLEEKYRRRYIPGQELYFAREHPRARATFVLDNNDPENPQWVTNRLRAEEVPLANGESLSL